MENTQNQTKKRVYTFGNGAAEGRADMKDLLGGKGANLAEMNLIGLPVPPGFTITTKVCIEYYKLGKRIVELLKPEVEKGIATLNLLQTPSLAIKKIPVWYRYVQAHVLLCRNDGHHTQFGNK